MANYNTFNLINTKTRKILLITSSPRKCKKNFIKGYRIDVWNDNKLVDVIYQRNIKDLNKYIKLEKEYIAKKQKKAQLRNERRRGYGRYKKQDNKIE